MRWDSNRSGYNLHGRQSEDNNNYATKCDFRWVMPLRHARL
jgi:hypothetical protein